MSAPITLYRWTGSPPCQAVLMVAKMLMLDLKLVEVDLMKDEQMKPDFLKLNPHHVVPTIDDNGFILWESRSIIIYLVEKYGFTDTLYPKDLAQRSKVNQRLFLDSELYERFGAFYFPPTFEGKPGNAKKFEDAVKTLKIFEEELSGQTYAAGNHLTVADIALATTISVADSFGYDLSVHPKIAAWFTKCKEEIAGYKEINQHGLDGLKLLVSSLTAKEEL